MKPDAILWHAGEWIPIYRARKSHKSNARYGGRRNMHGSEKQT